MYVVCVSVVVAMVAFRLKTSSEQQQQQQKKVKEKNKSFYRPKNYTSAIKITSMGIIHKWWLGERETRLSNSSREGKHVLPFIRNHFDYRILQFITC